MRVRHVLTVLAVRDPAASAAFYERAFDLRRTVDVSVYVELEDASGARIGLYEPAGFARNTEEDPVLPPKGRLSSTELYFHVDDVEHAATALSTAGARLLSPIADRPWGDRAAYFADPDGNVLVVASPIADEDRVA